MIDRLCEYIVKYMAFLVLVVALVSLFFSNSFLFIKTSYINYLLMVIMFGMGMTLKAEDFMLVLKQPKEIFYGTLMQYTIMPILAFCLCCAFHLDSALMAGVILVGTCPGGTASNVITYLSGGDVAFSVSMTAVNTLLSPVLTPLATYILLKQTVEPEVGTMFIGILNIVLIPIILGVLINKFFYSFSQKISKVLPLISVISICLVIASIVSHNSAKIFHSGVIILAVVVLHNILGCVFGFFAAKILRLKKGKVKAFSIEIGMQNSGLAASLANVTFPMMPEAAVPGAIFSVWHNISGAILAQIFRNWKDSDLSNQDEPC